MPSFWVDPRDVAETEFVLRGAEAHHLVRVRRARQGEALTAVDGCGMFYHGTIIEQRADFTRCRIDARCPDHGEPSVHLCLVPALVKKQRLDLVIEKTTELGVAAIRPLVAARGVVGKESAGRDRRWRRLARAAVKQCDRCRLPEIHPAAALAPVVSSLAAASYRLLVAVPGDSGPGLAALFPAGAKPHPLALLVGPEGGFTTAEVEMVTAAGGEVFSWQKRILRAETACIVLSALVLHEAEKSWSA